MIPGMEACGMGRSFESSNEPAGPALRRFSDVGCSARSDNESAFRASAGTEVNDPVGVPDDVKVVLDHNHGFP